MPYYNFINYTGVDPAPVPHFRLGEFVNNRVRVVAIMEGRIVESTNIDGTVVVPSNELPPSGRFYLVEESGSVRYLLGEAALEEDKYGN